jgi:hypothetical protein
MKNPEKSEISRKRLSTGEKVAIVTAVVVAATTFEVGGIAYTKDNNEHISNLNAALHPWNIGLSPQVEIISTTYDKDADKQTVQAGTNAVPIASQEKLTSVLEGSMKVEGDQTHPQVTLLYPAEMTDGDISDLAIAHPAFKHFNEYTQEWEDTEMGQDFSVLKKGTKIILPIKEGEVFQIMSGNRDDASYYGGLIFRFTDANNYPCELRIVGLTLEDMKNLKPLDTVINAPMIGKDGFVGRFEKTNEKGILIDGATKVLETTKDNVMIHIDLVTMNPQFSHVKIRFAPSDNNELLYLTPDFKK